MPHLIRRIAAAAAPAVFCSNPALQPKEPYVIPARPRRPGTPLALAFALVTVLALVTATSILRAAPAPAAPAPAAHELDGGLDRDLDRDLPLPAPPSADPLTLPDPAEAPSSADLCVLALAAGTEAGERDGWSDETLPFSVRFQDEVSPYRLMSLFVQPGERVELAVTPGPRGDGAAEPAACAEGGELAPAGVGAWSWRAPRSEGLHRLAVADGRSGEVMHLQAFVLRPYRGQAAVDGYRIGQYQARPLRGLPSYRRPEAMLRVTRDLARVRLSPHFRLDQFLCKQEGDPKFVVLRTRMLLQLETLLAEVNAAGIATPTFAVLSGYRTPWYNATIGNDTSYSRHAYGDAADIFVDLDGDGRMDDINGDGRIDDGDARVLYDIAEAATHPGINPEFVGGIGLYGPKPHRGPFVHVDTRGYPARW